jgi:hypothetical protein
VELNVFLPQTAEDVLDRATDIMAFLLAEEGVEPEPDIIEFLSAYPHTLYLFYDGDKPLGMIRLDDCGMNPELGRHTVQIHGATLPEYRGQADKPALFVLEAAFKKKKNIIAKVDPRNLGAVGFCRRWEFRKINREHGLIVYRLKRSEFMRRNYEQ